MKLRILLSIAVAALFAAPASAEHSAKELKMLDDSASALVPYKADLSERLRDYVKRASSDRWAKAERRSKAAEGQDLELLHESAAALEQTRPDLSNKLMRFAAEERLAAEEER